MVQYGRLLDSPLNVDKVKYFVHLAELLINLKLIIKKKSLTYDNVFASCAEMGVL